MSKNLSSVEKHIIGECKGPVLFRHVVDAETMTAECSFVVLNNIVDMFDHIESSELSKLQLTYGENEIILQSDYEKYYCKERNTYYTVTPAAKHLFEKVQERFEKLKVESSSLQF